MINAALDVSACARILDQLTGADKEDACKSSSRCLNALEDIPTTRIALSKSIAWTLSQQQ